MGKAEYLTALKEGVARLQAIGADRTVVVHHNDADGLSAAAVLAAALSRAGYRVERVPLERVHPPVNQRLHDRFAGIPILYVDLGARAAPMIALVNRGRSLTLIVDHHFAEDTDDPDVLVLSTELYGLSGEKEISAATAAWLFAQALDGANQDLAYLGVIGAIGDSHDRDGRLTGENREALEEALSRGEVEVREEGGREAYFLTKFAGKLPLKKFAKALTTLGAAGYAMGGPALGVRTLLSGPSPEYEGKLAELQALKRERFEAMLEKLRAGALRKSRHVQWFSVGDAFAPMGVKIIGEFCMEIRDLPFLDPDKYIAGFQDQPSEIPGLGSFDWDLVKVSMRVPTPLERKIVAGQWPGLAWLLPEAAVKVGGTIDACHDYAAASLIPRGKEAELVRAMDGLVKEYLK
ncbi:TPA: DHH family phosphoesterase [Candidatus Bipolaricaulota bacterium]|nr:DHH family phosphoesterase [Candidatus Bipolaricaulota bacterium]